LARVANEESHEKAIVLTNLAVRLDIESLRDFLCAWCSAQVTMLSEGVNLMDGAERIRSFFNIPNEWTDEEMGHLRLEMEYYETQKKSAGGFQ
jgi:hypothetical protein